MAQQPEYAISDDLDTPYLQAKAAWDDRIGTSRLQAKNWRIVAYACLLSNLILIFGVLHFAGRNTIIPYIVEVAETGHVRSVGTLAPRTYEPREATVKYFMAHWVEWVRSLSPDPVIVRRNWERAYTMLTSRGANTLSRYAREVQPFSRIGEMTVTVAIAKVLPMSSRSYEVEWVETITNVQGAPVSKTRYAGYFNILIKLPEREDIFETNPLGIFIDTFNWAKERV